MAKYTIGKYSMFNPDGSINTDPLKEARKKLRKENEEIERKQRIKNRAINKHAKRKVDRLFGLPNRERVFYVLLVPSTYEVDNIAQEMVNDGMVKSKEEAYTDIHDVLMNISNAMYVKARTEKAAVDVAKRNGNIRNARVYVKEINPKVFNMPRELPMPTFDIKKEYKHRVRYAPIKRDVLYGF